VTRPVLKIKVEAADGSFRVEFFLVDRCADRTVFSADLLSKLNRNPIETRSFRSAAWGL